MKLFGHYVTRLFVVLITVDAAIFLGAIQWINFSSQCSGCYAALPIRLEIYSSAALTAAFLLITTSFGLYAPHGARDYRTFARRFLLVWQIILIPSVLVVAIGRIAAGEPIGVETAILPLAISLMMLSLFCLHLALAWGFGLPFMKKRLLVLGEGAQAEAIVAFVQGPGRTHYTHLQTIGSWRSGGAPRVGNLLLRSQPEPIAVSELAQALRADEIVVAVEERRGLPVTELLDCKLMGVAVVDALTFWEREAGQIDPSQVGAGWLTFSDGFALDRRHRVLKRLADLIVSLTFLIAMLPLILLTALAIRLESPGPVFYRQERVGLNGRPFHVWKFRSMRSDAERDGVPQWAKKGDDRVTRVGRFIRKVRIDEIPQVINVLAGEMSFIGPRPERPFFVEQLRELIPHYDLRHRVRPGITGWAQVNYPYGASVEDAARKLSYDLFYLKKNDLLLDLAILVQTVRVVLFANGAR